MWKGMDGLCRSIIPIAVILEQFELESIKVVIKI